MGIGSAFQTSGKTASITAGVAVVTPLIRWTDLGLTQSPQALRLVNNGTVDVWVWISNAAQGGTAFPTAGTASGVGGAGTPQYGFRLKPGVVEVFGFNAVNLNPNNEQPQNPGFFFNNLSTVAGQIVDISPGEGI
jgi:hypothetical protein